MFPNLCSISLEPKMDSSSAYDQIDLVFRLFSSSRSPFCPFNVRCTGEARYFT